jgi:hypothetical protein
MANKKLKPDKIYKVLVMTEDPAHLSSCTAIMHNEKLWLVPQWLDNPTEQTTKPERIICVDGMYQPGGKVGHGSFDFVLNVAIPKAVLEGPIQSQIIGNFVVIGLPNIEFRMKARIH